MMTPDSCLLAAAAAVVCTLGPDQTHHVLIGMCSCVTGGGMTLLLTHTESRAATAA